MIEVEGLSKHYRVHEREGGAWGSLKAVFKRTYKTVKAVEDVSFQIPAGGIVGFLGPNGAGKTTTLKILAGLLHPTAGQATVAGFTPRLRQRAFLTSITMVLGQKQQLIWDLPPEDTFLLNKEIYGVSDADYRRRLDQLVDMLSLGDLIKRQARKLSLGERMKCELAAALLHGPRVLFLDEPTIGLDVNMQQALRTFIASYNKESGATILLTSHYMADVTALCKRVLVINEGRLVFDGDLAGIAGRVALDKRIKLSFSSPVALKELASVGRIVRAEGLEAELEVPRAETAAAAQRLLERLPVADITIEDPPIEAIVGAFMTSNTAAMGDAS